MNFLHTPDCLILLSMVYVLYRLRKNRDLSSLRLWTYGLLLIVAEIVARMLYYHQLPDLYHYMAHAAALDAYCLAGYAFFLTSWSRLRQTPRYKLCLLANLTPHLLLLTAYGMTYRNWTLFVALSVCGLAGGLGLSLLLRHGYRACVIQLAFWGPVLGFSLASQYRAASYYVLFSIYIATALGFARNLPRRRYGRAMVSAAFGIWALCFLTHPWVGDRKIEVLSAMADRIWDLQSFLATFGLLILSLEEASAAHEYEALHDELTGLPNRRLFTDRLQLAMARSKREQTRVVLFNIDLDGFKSVNDTWGHEAGDALLRAVAKRLDGLTRATDTLCRVGGDEFYLLFSEMPAESPEALQQQVQRLMTELRQRVEAEPYTLAMEQETLKLHAALSIGHAIYPDQADAPDELCRVADKRMYENKQLRAEALALR